VSDEQKVPSFVRILISVTNPQQNTCDRSLHGGAPDQTPETLLRAKLVAEPTDRASHGTPPGMDVTPKAWRANASLRLVVASPLVGVTAGRLAPQPRKRAYGLRSVTVAHANGSCWIARPGRASFGALGLP
jgi:hypothetical protein